MKTDRAIHTRGALATTLLIAAGMAQANAAVPFAVIQGDQFLCNGRVYKLKGTNYYPRDHQWASMWSSWDWPEITTECAMMRDLGLNSVRILVPYSQGGWGGPLPPASRLQQLEDIVNLMGENGIRSCVTLFDWETSFPAAGTDKERDHLSYLSAIVNRLKNNPFVLFWDVKNEPDHPDNYGWCDCDPGPCGNWDCNPAQRNKIVDWLQRMCNAVRAIDAHHPVAAGMRWYENVDDVLGFVDVAIFHSYWPTIGTVQIPTVKAYMGANQKPLVIEEFGWPSHPSPCWRGFWVYDYTEQKQLEVFQINLDAFVAHGIAGGIQWMTFDSRPYSGDPYDSFEHYFGLWRYAYTLKPAGLYYRDHYPVSPFPATPPGQVVAFSAVPVGTTIRLSWTNPPDADFAGTLVRYGTAGFPSGPGDGTLLCDRPGSPGASEVVEHQGLNHGVEYFYSAFAYDRLGNFATPANARARTRAPGDFDGDDDVDMTDFGHLQLCISGAYIAQTDPACQDARLDQDEDVDQEDVAIFQRCLSGADLPPAKDCTN